MTFPSFINTVTDKIGDRCNICSFFLCTSLCEPASSNSFITNSLFSQIPQQDGLCLNILVLAYIPLAPNTLNSIRSPRHTGD